MTKLYKIINLKVEDSYVVYNFVRHKFKCECYLSISFKFETYRRKSDYDWVKPGSIAKITTNGINVMNIIKANGVEVFQFRRDSKT